MIALTTIERYENSREAIHRAFPMEGMAIAAVSALSCLLEGREVTEEGVRGARALIKKEAGAFSAFRHSALGPAAARLAASDDPEGELEKALSCHALLRTEFPASRYLPLLALTLPQLDTDGGMAGHIREGKALYDRMRAEHPFLTGREDSVMAVLMTYSGKDMDTLLRDMESGYRALKDAFRWGTRDALQTVSHMLAFDEPLEGADRLCALFRSIRERGARYGDDYELAPLCALSRLGLPEEETAENVKESAELLKGRKRYGVFGLDTRQRLTHAVLLILSEQGVRAETTGAILASGIMQIAAQQAAMAACCAAAASSHSSSGA